MKEFKGTKGEWKIRNEANNFIAVDAHFKDKSFTPIFISELITDEENNNAKLIAAAPELLEALQGFTRQLGGECDGVLAKLVKNADKAISKALD